jgi:hypothetical protein
MGALHLEHGREQIELPEDPLDDDAVELLELQKRERHRVDRLPDEGQRLASDVVEAIDFPPDFLDDLADAGAEHLLYGASAVGPVAPNAEARSGSTLERIPSPTSTPSWRGRRPVRRCSAANPAR